MEKVIVVAVNLNGRLANSFIHWGWIVALWIFSLLEEWVIYVIEMFKSIKMTQGIHFENFFLKHSANFVVWNSLVETWWQPSVYFETYSKYSSINRTVLLHRFCPALNKPFYHWDVIGFHRFKAVGLEDWFMFVSGNNFLTAARDTVMSIVQALHLHWLWEPLRLTKSDFSNVFEC